jgi:hypothetical protein
MMKDQNVLGISVGKPAFGREGRIEDNVKGEKYYG